MFLFGVCKFLISTVFYIIIFIGLYILFYFFKKQAKMQNDKELDLYK